VDTPLSRIPEFPEFPRVQHIQRHDTLNRIESRLDPTALERLQKHKDDAGKK
jgi:hypothetical protein